MAEQSEVRNKKESVRGLIREGVKAGLTDAEIIAMINERLPGRAVRQKSIGWFRRHPPE
jgi:hypothetical protein